MFIFGPIMILLAGALALYTGVDLARHWASFWDNHITGQDRLRAYRVVFFLIIPLGVLLHEVGHALAVWQLGGRVVEFNWSLLSGYVVPDRAFPPLPSWWIYFSGNLVSILVSFVGLAVAALARRPMIRYLGFTFFTLQWYFSLIGYPLLSLGSQDGDWAAIYGIPPWPLKLLLAAVHVSLLLMTYRILRRPSVRRWELMLSEDNRQVIAGLEGEMRANPADPGPRLALARFYAQRGESALARATLGDALAATPDNAEALILSAALAADQEKYAEAADLYQKALASLPPGPGRARVAALLGEIYLRLDRADEAMRVLTQALGVGVASPEAFYWRGRAYLRLNDEAAARLDFERAAQLDPQGAAGAEAAKELAAMR